MVNSEKGEKKERDRETYLVVILLKLVRPLYVLFNIKNFTKHTH